MSCHFILNYGSDQVIDQIFLAVNIVHLCYLWTAAVHDLDYKL